MRQLSWVAISVLGLIACGKHPAARDGNAPVSEQMPPDAPACDNGSPGTTVTMRKIATIDGRAILVTSPPNDPRLFVVEQSGVIQIIDDGQLLPTPFLDISVANGGPVIDTTLDGEVGLLGLAFDPDYATNGEFYVFYNSLIRPTDNDPYDNLARYRVTAADPDVADPMSGAMVLQLPRTRPNHNAGMLEFGADGYLYASTGDGGSNGDRLHTAEDPHALHAKMLRIDVDHRPPGMEYSIPPDNPFADGVVGAPEVYMQGLRNPWRWSFDRATGDMWIGDVGQGQTEELDVVRAGAQAGVNFGWPQYEGMSCCATQADKCTEVAPMPTPCDPTGKTFPLDVRSHADGWLAIIGGQVYRGSCYPDLVGWYFYTDYMRGVLARARLHDDGTLEVVDLPGTYPTGVSSLHADSQGELYETDISGNIYHLEASP